MATHEFKCWPGPFEAIRIGVKRFEWRKDDREPPFEVGDWLHLQEWIPIRDRLTSGGRYTGRMIAVRVSYVARGPDFDIPPGYVVMSLDEMTCYPRGDD